MVLQFPDKAKITELFSDGEKPDLPDGVDFVEVLALGIEGLKVAIEEFPLNEYKSMEELIGYDPYYQVDPTILQEKNVPSVMLICDEEGLPQLHLRVFSDDGTWLGEGKFNLISATGYFAAQAHDLISGLKQSGTVVTDEDFEIFIVRKTANMLKEAFEKLRRRIEISLQSFLEETAWNYAELWYRQHAEFNSMQGFQTKRINFGKQREKALRNHVNAILELHADDSSETLSDLRKQLLALNYPKILEHWKEIQRIQLDGKNWRRYVNAGDMDDVTDDLVEQFERVTDISGLAIEHAARRAELYNTIEVREQRLEKRKRGIRDSGYSRSRLFELKKEGERLLENRDSHQSTTS